MAEDQNCAARWRFSTLVRGGGNSKEVVAMPSSSASSLAVVDDESGVVVAALAMNSDCLALEALAGQVVVVGDVNACAGGLINSIASASAMDGSFMVSGRL